MSRLKPSTTAVTLVCALVLGSCSDDGVGPTLNECEEIICTFTAETFTTTMNGETTDQLAQGATLTITLREDGTTTGSLFVPGGDEDGGDFDASLDGSYSFDESTDRVTFDHDADTFVRDMTFSVIRSGGFILLEGEETFGSTTITVVLS